MSRHHCQLTFNNPEQAWIEMADMNSVIEYIRTQDLDTCIAYGSPLLYMIYVEIAKIILPYETKDNKHIFYVLKLVHNVGLAIASLLMLIGILVVASESNKFVSIHAALCGPFHNIERATLVGRYFYLSKYWEWVDTAFLITARKDVSWLQYTHHMSTAILVFANLTPVISSASLLACFTNTFVHVFMYFYFAFPHGFLKKYRQFITIIQIIQHVACLSGFLYMYFNIDNCVTTLIGIKMCLMLYAMYLTFFVLFYIVQYVQGGSANSAIKKAKLV